MAYSVELLETMRWQRNGGFVLLHLHLDRLRSSAAFFGLPLPDELRERLNSLDEEFRRADVSMMRVRLVVSETGIRLESSAMPEGTNGPQPVALSTGPVDADDVSLRHKTTDRAIYENAGIGLPDGVEPLLCNRDGRVTESAIANLVWVHRGVRYTPPVSDGLLPGVYRRFLLEQGEIRERSLAVRDLAAVDELYLINALRGWRPARLVTV